MITTKLRSIVHQIIDAKKTTISIPIQTPIRHGDELLGKVAIVTGGSGGIGLAIAKELLSCGAKVAILGTNENKLNVIKNEISESDDKLKFFVIDLNNIDTFATIVNTIEDSFSEKAIHILVNCAGIVSTHDFWNTTQAEFDSIMNVNIRGMYFLSREVALAMKKKHIKGHILNISSSSSVRPAWTPYQISKWAVNGFTKGLADILINDGIVVNAIAPGPAATDIFGISEGQSITNETNPAGRFVTKEEIAVLAAYMVSSMADMIVGETIFITGGSGIISYHR